MYLFLSISAAVMALITGLLNGVMPGFLSPIVPAFFVAGSLGSAIVGWQKTSRDRSAMRSAYVGMIVVAGSGTALVTADTSMSLIDEWRVERFCEARGKLTGATSEIRSRSILFSANCNVIYDICRDASFDTTRAITLLKKGFEFIEYQHTDIGTSGPRNVFARVYLTARPNPDCNAMDNEFGSMSRTGEVNAVDRLSRYGISPETCMAIRINEPPQSEYRLDVRKEESSDYFSDAVLTGVTLSTVRGNKRIAKVESVTVGAGGKRSGHDCRNFEDFIKILDLVQPARPVKP